MKDVKRVSLENTISKYTHEFTPRKNHTRVKLTTVERDLVEFQVYVNTREIYMDIVTLDHVQALLHHQYIMEVHQ